MEIEKETETTMGESKVGEQLSLMNVEQRINRLELNNHLVLHEEIHPVGIGDLQALVLNRANLLLLEGQLSQLEFMRQGQLVSRLQKPRAKIFVNLNRRTNDLLGELVDF